MKTIFKAWKGWLATASLLVLLGFSSPTYSQGIGNPNNGTTITFKNDLKIPVVIQGTSIVGGMFRKGQTVIIGPGNAGVENNVPPGNRLYSVYDGTQASKVLAKDIGVVVPPNQNIGFFIRPSGVGRVKLDPDFGK